MACRELADYIENGNVKNSVNFPECSIPRTGDFRIAVYHQNIPNVLSKLLSRLSQDNVNVENMVSKVRKDAAYTLLDISGSCDGIEKEIEGHEGIIKVRVIK